MITQSEILVEDSVTRNHMGVPCVTTVLTSLVTHEVSGRLRKERQEYPRSSFDEVSKRVFHNSESAKNEDKETEDANR